MQVPAQLSRFLALRKLTPCLLAEFWTTTARKCPLSSRFCTCPKFDFVLFMNFLRLQAVSARSEILLVALEVLTNADSPPSLFC
jgi:hypothetical protein